MHYLRLLLFPIALLYGILIFLRNFLYDIGIFPTKDFEHGVIVIGNLSTGGTGKSPMTEYLIRLLKDRFPVSTLSRGYKRHTSGFLLVQNDATSFQVGDEPLQFRKKFSDITVAVDENRKHGIVQLRSQFPGLQAILLDDAFQHRRIKAGMNILLSDYGRMFYDDFLLPAGTLREWRAGKKRADVVIVTKCPDSISPVEKRIIIKKIDPEAHQQVFFSHIRYGEMQSLTPSPTPRGERGKGRNLSETTIVLLAGVSNPKPLEEYLLKKSGKVIPQFYPDHHEYSLVEVTRLREIFEGIPSQDKIIITTEKDAMRLDKPGLMEALGPLPVFYIPIEVTFEEKEKEAFDKLIRDYVIRTNHK